MIKFILKASTTLVLFFFVQSTIASEPRFLLTGKYQKDHLRKHLIPIEDYAPFPRASERSAWYTSTNITTHQLDQNYLNPFYLETTIKYYLPRSGNVVLKIYNLSGQEIKTLVNGSKTAGEHSITLQPEDLPGGMYYYGLQVEDPSPIAGPGYSETKKLILQK